MKGRLGPEPEQRRLQREQSDLKTRGRGFAEPMSRPDGKVFYRHGGKFRHLPRGIARSGGGWTRVLLACHDQRKAKAAMAQIGQVTPNRRTGIPAARSSRSCARKSRSRTRVRGAAHQFATDQKSAKRDSRILGANISSSDSVAQRLSFVLGTCAALRALGRDTQGTGKTRQNAGLSIHGRRLQSG